MVMKDELVRIVVAKLAKEKGFNETCIDTFDDEDKPTNKYNLNIHEDMSDEEIQKEFEVKNSDLVEGYTARPTQSLLQRWLRETHEIHITITSISQESWQCHMTKKGDSLGKCYLEDFISYEEALEEGLLQGLKLIK